MLAGRRRAPGAARLPHADAHLPWPRPPYPTPRAFHMPMYVMGDVTPGIAGTSCSFSRSCAPPAGASDESD